MEPGSLETKYEEMWSESILLHITVDGKDTWQHVTEHYAVTSNLDWQQHGQIIIILTFHSASNVI